MPWWKNIFCHSSCVRCLSHIAHILSDKRKDKIQSWELEKTKEIEEEHVTVNISHFLSQGRAGASFRALSSMAHTCLQGKPACPAVWRNNPSRVWRRDSRRAQEGEPGVHFNSHTWHLCQEVKQPWILLQIYLMCLIGSLCLQHRGTGAQNSGHSLCLWNPACSSSFEHCPFNSFFSCACGWLLGMLHHSEQEIMQEDHSLMDSALHLQVWHWGLYTILFTYTLRFYW